MSWNWLFLQFAPDDVAGQYASHFQGGDVDICFGKKWWALSSHIIGQGLDEFVEADVPGLVESGNVNLMHS
eukprot:864544-Karenia_brevis.AAC.1